VNTLSTKYIQSSHNNSSDKEGYVYSLTQQQTQLTDLLVMYVNNSHHYTHISLSASYLVHSWLTCWLCMSTIAIIIHISLYQLAIWSTT